MVNSKKRERKLDLESLSPEDLSRLENEISEKLRNIIDDACEKANHLVSPFGAKVLMQFQIEPKSEENSPQP